MHGVSVSDGVTHELSEAMGLISTTSGALPVVTADHNHDFSNASLHRGRPLDLPFLETDINPKAARVDSDPFVNDVASIPRSDAILRGDAFAPGASALLSDPAPLLPVVKVLVNGLSQTAGLEECLTDAPPSDEDNLDDAVPERLTIPAVFDSFKVLAVPSRDICAVLDTAAQLIDLHRLEDTFCVVDLGSVQALYQHMIAAMPRVRPHYAVKCFPNPGLIATLAALGAGFDCASEAEVDHVTSLGVPASRIILAHPVKRPCDLRCIASKGVPYTTFDSEGELHKIAAAKVDCGLVLRIRADDPNAKVSFGTKYGAWPRDAPHLLSVARLLGLRVVGVSFHVGTGAASPAAYRAALQAARDVFDVSLNRFGVQMTLLDIGGGFQGEFHGGVVSEFPKNTFATISAALDELFPRAKFPNLRVISEPGRYFAAGSASVCTMVYGKRQRQPKAKYEERAFDYYITDGVYGNFNGIIYDMCNPEMYVLSATAIVDASSKDPDRPRPSTRSRFTTVHESTIFGPTCDSVDVVMKSVYCPELHNGDWLVFPDFGAYSVAGACDFNGMLNGQSNCRSFYVWSKANTSATASSTFRARNAVKADEPSLKLEITR